MEEYKDKFNNKLSIYPLNVEKDTLMACFSTFINGSESYVDRMKLRQKIISHFKKCLECEKPYNQLCIRSFVSRLKDVPKSAEMFYLNSEAKFRYMAEQFIIENSQEGYISDKYTFAYIVSELFKIHVNFVGDTEISANLFDVQYYTIYIVDNFKLLTHYEKIQRVQYKPSNGLTVEKAKIATSKYELRLAKNGECPVIANFVPPSIVGYKVHTLYLSNFDENSVYCLTLKSSIEETLFIYNNFKCISSIKRNAKVNSYFYVEHSFLQCVVANDQNEADRAVRYEAL